MKRLIKKSKYYDSYMNGKKQIDIFRNPDTLEVKEIKDAFDNNVSKNTLRLFLHADGTIYVWNGNILHEYIGQEIPSTESPVCISTYSNGMEIYLKSEIKGPEDLKAYFVSGKSNLNYAGIGESTTIKYINTRYYGSTPNEIYQTFKTIGDIYNYQTEQTP